MHPMHLIHLLCDLRTTIRSSRVSTPNHPIKSTSHTPSIDNMFTEYLNTHHYADLCYSPPTLSNKALTALTAPHIIAIPFISTTTSTYLVPYIQRFLLNHQQTYSLHHHLVHTSNATYIKQASLQITQTHIKPFTTNAYLYQTSTNPSCHNIYTNINNVLKHDPKKQLSHHSISQPVIFLLIAI